MQTTIQLPADKDAPRVSVIDTPNPDWLYIELDGQVALRVPVSLARELATALYYWVDAPQRDWDMERDALMDETAAEAAGRGHGA